MELRVLDGRPNADCIILAGHMGTIVEGRKSDTVRPLPAWYIYENPEQAYEEVEDIHNEATPCEFPVAARY